MKFDAVAIAQLLQIAVKTGLDAYQISKNLRDSGVENVPTDEELDAANKDMNAVVLKSGE